MRHPYYTGITPYYTGITISFYEYLKKIIAESILYNDEQTILRFDFEEVYLFDIKNEDFLNKDIKEIKDWGLKLGYEIKISYHQEPMFSEERRKNSEISSFILTPPSILIEITKQNNINGDEK